MRCHGSGPAPLEEPIGSSCKRKSHHAPPPPPPPTPPTMECSWNGVEWSTHTLPPPSDAGEEEVLAFGITAPSDPGNAGVAFVVGLQQVSDVSALHMHVP